MNGPIELWGGVECTVNRVGDAFFDQVHRTGHHDRLGDLNLIASLGVKALRYPVLWERVAPDGLENADWSWTDERLERLRALGVRPIAGLIHHGSGPRTTSLMDPSFPQLFARYAQCVAERYPWISDYTPVNEPLTTARFSGLYGHWYPHLRSNAAFVCALLTQIKGSILAMRAIRAVNPDARLIQTEDGGRTYGTPLLRKQAEHENHRRWLTFDLLTGRVRAGHPLWRWLLKADAPRDDLDWIADNACPPDVLGLNYYFTSDRYIDEQLDTFPPHTHGGNGEQRYADVEAPRARPAGQAGHRRVLVDAWERYGISVALTEVHAGASRDDQMRWLHEAWRGAERARSDGADVRAVTLWSLFGCVDWNSLLVRTDQHYEVGVFDARSDPPRPTAVAALARALATGSRVDAIASGRGWWRRPERITCGPAFLAHAPSRELLRSGARPLLIVGASGTLGSALVLACAERGIAADALGRDRLDVSDAAAIRRTIAALRPWAVINAAGQVRVDDAEGDAAHCVRVNTDAPAAMAEACALVGARFVTYSSDLVFDGRSRRPYVESDRAEPLNVYGFSKVAAEDRVRDACPAALIIRTSAFFGPVDEHNFLTMSLRSIAAGRPVSAADDVVVSPTYVPDLVQATLDLLLDSGCGIWHLSNQGETTWADFARGTARRAGLDANLVTCVASERLGWRALRPRYCAMGSERGLLLPSLDDAVARYLAVTRPLSARTA